MKIISTRYEKSEEEEEQDENELRAEETLEVITHQMASIDLNKEDTVEISQ